MRKRVIVIFSLTALLFVLFTIPTKASILDDVKKFFGIGKPEEPRNVSVESDISLVPDAGGDIDGNGEIDAGDVIRFQYVLKNPSDTEYSWLDLDTKINRKFINFIHNDYGIVNLDDDGENIIIRHIRLYPGQEISLRFDARVNLSSKQDVPISTEPKLVDKDNKEIAKSSKKEVSAKKLSEEKLKLLSGEKASVLNSKE